MFCAHTVQQLLVDGTLLEPLKSEQYLGALDSRWPYKDDLHLHWHKGLHPIFIRCNNYWLTHLAIAAFLRQDDNIAFHNTTHAVWVNFIHELRDQTKVFLLRCLSWQFYFTLRFLAAWRLQSESCQKKYFFRFRFVWDECVRGICKALMRFKRKHLSSCQMLSKALSLLVSSSIL